MRLGDMLETTAEKYPRRVAVVFEKEKIKYEILNNHVNRLAHALMQLDVSVGDRVALWMVNSPEYLISYYAAAKIGGVSVPINTFLKGEEVAFILNDAGVNSLIVSPEYYEEFKEVAKKIRTVKNIIISTRDEDEFNKIFRTRNPNFQYFSIASLLKEEPPSTIHRKFSDEDLAVLIYTSGTTGFPKGAMLTHKNLISNAKDCEPILDLSPKDRMLVFLPMFHSFTELVCMVLPVLIGMRMIILPKIDQAKIRHALIRHRPTLFVGVPTVYNNMVQAKLSNLQKKLNPVKIYVSGAAPLSYDVITRFKSKFDRPLLEGYGLSEASPVVSVNPLEEQRPLSVGLPVTSVEVKIVDDNEKEMKTGEVGEIIARGPNIMKGYWNQPEETEKALRNGWLFTGDMGKVDDDGYIYIVDRKKDMLIYRGQNIYPREIEEALYNHPKIKECAVVGIKDTQKGEIPKAYIALQEGEKATEKEMKDYLKERMANYKIPRYIAFLDELPKTPTGKILKKDLRELAQKEGISEAEEAED